MKAVKEVAELPAKGLSCSADLVLRIVIEEHEKMLALVQCMAQRLAPKDTMNIPDNFDFTSWRFAEMLEERLESVELTNLLHSVLEQDRLG